MGVFFNGFEGPLAAPAEQAGTFSDPVVMPVPAGRSGTMTLSNLNIVPMDIDADGRSDLLHMPRVANYGYFTPARDVQPIASGAVSPLDQGWRWSYVERAVPPGTTDPRIDLSGDPTHIRSFDVNNDHLIDVVRTTGTSMQTWLNLGWLPEGDGRFGTATYIDGAWTLSTDPIERCLPHAGLPIDFADPEVKLGDMNGDGLQDIVRLHAGSLVYWPGRGDGTWGDGAVDCPVGFVGDREITVTNPPAELNAELDAVFLSDVNSDGTDDVVQVRYTAIDVWFNKVGIEFTDRVIASGTPFAPAFANRVRVVDIDGSATTDILYANSGAWRWVDLMGGVRPRLLEMVTATLGAEMTLAYASSAEDYLADLRDAAICVASDCERFTWASLPGDCDGKVLAGSGDCVYRPGGSPVISTVIRTTTSDSGLPTDPPIVNAYAYHDGYYEGAEFEFRGFGAATEQAIGDTIHPTSYKRTFFHQGRRTSDIASDPLADNPDEPLKGESYRTETWNEAGEYLSTSNRTLEVRPLHIGLDGRVCRDVVPIQADTLLYDVDDFADGGEALTLPHVLRGEDLQEIDVIIRAEPYALTRATADDVDNLGQALQSTQHGRIEPATPGEDLGDETIVSHAQYVNVDDSATGWLWRASLTWVDGHGIATDLGSTTHVFNEAGDEITTTIAVDQASAYSFSPTLGSPSPEDIVASRVVDAWGNGTIHCLGGDDAASGDDCLRYATVAYDAEWAAFPESASQATARDGSGWTMLTTTAVWDTALGAVTTVSDPNEDVSSVTYDGFGRLTSFTPPPAVGCDAGVESARIQYELTTPGGLPVSRVMTTTVLSCDGEETLETMAYVDGLGRVRASIATGDGTTGRDWIRTGVVALSSRGTTNCAWQPAFYSGPTSPSFFAVSEPSTACFQTLYDAFGRVSLAVEVDGAMTATVYHALSQEIWDENDLNSGHQFASTPTTIRVDGHGRTIDQVLIHRQPGGEPEDDEYHRLFTTYRADGAVTNVTRALTDSGEPAGITDELATVGRDFIYDTAGRRIATTDPDTDGRVSEESWRYLFNRTNDLVAVRDPRNCGQDFFYDHAGRTIAEKYIACSEAMLKYDSNETVPAGAVLWTETTASASVNVRNFYDSYDDCWEDEPSSLDDYPTNEAGGMLGRLACDVDRAQRSIYAYDHRGQLTWHARQVLLLGEVGSFPLTLSNPPPDIPTKATLWPPTQSVVYEQYNTWVATRTYDHGSRPRALVLPPSLEYYETPRRVGRIEYGPRGLPAASSVDLVTDGTIDSIVDGAIDWGSGTVDEHAIVTEFEYDADGQVARSVYGDENGSHEATESTIEYDDRRRPIHARTERDPTGSTDRSLAAVDVPFDQTLEWDPVSNLLSITDGRDANQWEPGHRPQNVALDYDSLYRVVDAFYTYNQDTGDPTTDDDATDWRDTHDPIRNGDLLRPFTASMAPALPDARVVSLTWQYDWLGNMTHWADDAGAFYERSLTDNEPIANGIDLEDVPGAPRPSAMYLATNLSGVESDDGGYVEVTYGDGGNVVTMTVHAQCGDETCEDPGGADLETRRDALHEDCVCAVEQHYEYIWDELNRLIEARRYDRAGSGNWAIVVHKQWAYSATNQRIVELTYDPNGSWPVVKWNVEVFPGDLELHDMYYATFSEGASFWPNENLGSETHNLLVGARIVWNAATPISNLDPGHRITINLTDIIGTTAGVIDLRSGEFIETSTYYPNGARETFRTEPTESILPERYGFTGKQADDDIGLIYFGERWLIQRLGRWASPDPLAIHALDGGEAMNSYHYIAGNLLQASDPIGLRIDDGGPISGACRGSKQCAALAAENAKIGQPEGVRIESGLVTTQFAGETVSFDATIYDGREVVGYQQYVTGPRGTDFWILSFDADLRLHDTSYGGNKPKGMTTRDHASLIGAGAGIIPYAGDYISLGVSVGLFIDEPSVEGGVDVVLDAAGAILPFAPAFGTLRRLERTAGVAGALLDARRAIAATAELVAQVARKFNHRGVFFDAYPHLKGKVWVHHAVEVQALKRYPGQFTKEEIQSLSNMRGIPKEINNELHLSKIRKEWNEFYRTHGKGTTREEILKKSEEIDAKYGSQFNPPL